uniref:Uncharacterized protein n=1 Tax=Trypanosoma congolense (strain IL3000) TaxID=1068625 RepID=G0USE8_TRYCI|nr:conserved hypothetical protein [Trypanosoma congolense IL3000]
MPYISTPFLVTLNAGERFPLRLVGGSQFPRFTASIHSVVFVRKSAAAPSTTTAVTVSLNVCSDDGGSPDFTIASHNFQGNGSVGLKEGTDRSKEKQRRDGDSAGTTSSQDSFSVVLRAPIRLSSHGPVHALEVKCDPEDVTDNGTTYSVTLHGTQRTVLSKEQVELLRSDAAS